MIQRTHVESKLRSEKFDLIAQSLTAKFKLIQSKKMIQNLTQENAN